MQRKHLAVAAIASTAAPGRAGIAAARSDDTSTTVTTPRTSSTDAGSESGDPAVAAATGRRLGAAHRVTAYPRPMPTPGDPSFDRVERATRAKEAASGASDERLAELRAKYLAPPPSPKRGAARRSATAGAAAPAPRPRPDARQSNPIDAAAIVRTARAALDKHPATWTSHAELCSAMGLTRSLASSVASEVTFDVTGPHWYRVRDDHGAYVAPEHGAEEGDAERPDAEQADARLEAIGVTVVDGRADPERKLAWTGSGWALHGEG